MVVSVVSCAIFIGAIWGIIATTFLVKVLTGWSWYHLRMRLFLSIAAYRARDPNTQLCYSQDNQTVISCELAAMTRLIKFRFTKDLHYHTHYEPDTIIPYSREQLNMLWDTTFPFDTHLPISVTLNDSIHNYNALWIVNRKHENTNDPLTRLQLQSLKQGLPETGVIVAIHGGAMVLGAASHLIPYLQQLSSMMGNLMVPESVPPILAFDYRLAPECPFPCQKVDVSFMIKQYLHNELGVPMNRIYLIGDSAGGMLSLLFLQDLAESVNYQVAQNVGGAVLISPGCDWTMNDGNGSWKENAEFDPVIQFDTIRLYRKYVFGIYEVDDSGNRKVTGNETAENEGKCKLEDEIPFDSPRISPCFGSFVGLPSIYVTVSELETLYDDGTRVIENANAAKRLMEESHSREYENVTYHLDVHRGSSLHELPLMAGLIPEATDSLCRIAEFLVDLTTKGT